MRQKRAQRRMCESCRSRLEDELEDARSRLRNMETVVDALSDALEEAETLCEALANHLLDSNAAFVDEVLDEDERALWESVCPFGRDDDQHTDT